MRLHCEFSTPLARSEVDAYVRHLVVSMKCHDKDFAVPYIVGKLAMDRVLWSDALADGVPLFDICDNDSQGLHEVFVREIKSAGFKEVGEEKFLKENYFVRVEKAGKTTPKRTLNDFQKSLDKALTPVKTVATFGEPDRKLESGLIIYEYDLEDGTKMRLDFPGFAAIQYAYHVQKDGKFVVIPLK